MMGLASVLPSRVYTSEYPPTTSSLAVSCLSLSILWVVQLHVTDTKGYVFLRYSCHGGNVSQRGSVPTKGSTMSSYICVGC